MGVQGQGEKTISNKGWQARPRKPPSVLSLFNMKVKSKFWNENVMSHGELIETYWVHVFF